MAYWLQRAERLVPQQRRDLLAAGLLVLLPVVVFGIPAAAGHPILTGDNLIQNYPLRVLAGRQLSHGNLPLWDPYIWSGSPLLAGFNAGAMYPFTMLFAVMNSAAAWALNEMVVFVVASLGVFAFCRALRLAPLASFLGAVSFGFAGAMSAQLVHFGLVAGMSWVPWMALAMNKIAEGNTRLWGWVALLAASGGLIVLAGEPRAISDAAVVALVYGVWLLWQIRPTPRSRSGSGRGRTPAELLMRTAGRIRSSKRWAFAGYLGIAGLWAFALGAIQLLPGIQFLHDSQRSAGSFENFSAGSLPIGWSLLLVVPDLLGGSGSFGQPRFVGNYPLTEATAYVGLLPLVAAFSLFVQSRWPGSKSASSKREWGAWYLVGAAGLILSWGNNTAFGRVLWHIPLYGGQRLQSRNLLVVDLALALLLAYWIDDVLTPITTETVVIPDVDETVDEEQMREAIHARREAIRRSRELVRQHKWLDSYTAKVTAAFPALFGVVVCLVALYWGPGFARAFSNVDALTAVRHYRELIPSLVTSLVLCLGAAGIAAFHRTLSRRAKAVIIVGFIVVDIAVFTGTSVVELSSSAISTAKAEVSSAIGGSPSVTVGSGSTGVVTGSATSRYAIFDPDLINNYGLANAGQPDLNILSSTLSVQGYSSIAPGSYANATGTHGQDVLSPDRLYGRTFDPLDLQYLYTLPNYLITTLGPHGASSGQEWQVPVGGSRGWYFGTTEDISDLQFTNLVQGKIPPGTLSGVKIGLVRPDGTYLWPPVWGDDQPGTGFLALDPPVQAIGLVIRNLSPTYTEKMTGLVLTTSDDSRVGVQGSLAGYLDPAVWQYVGPAYGYQLFQRRLPSVGAELLGPDGSSAVAGSGAAWKVVTGSLYGSATIDITTPAPATFVRSVGYTSGWHATLETPPTPGSGPHDLGSLAVTRYGLVQAVLVPAGTHFLKLTYRPATVVTGTFLTLCGTIALVVVLLALYSRPALSSVKHLKRSWRRPSNPW